MEGADESTYMWQASPEFYNIGPRKNDQLASGFWRTGVKHDEMLNFRLRVEIAKRELSKKCRKMKKYYIGICQLLACASCQMFAGTNFTKCLANFHQIGAIL